MDALDLSGNRLAGQLPVEFAGMQLTSLRLSNSSIGGSIPPGGCRHSLQILPSQLAFRSRCAFTPGLYAGWLATGAWPLLEQLDLSGNPKLTGSLAPSASPAKAASSSGPVYLPNLASLNLSGCSLVSTLPATLPPSLQVLELSNNSGITGALKHSSACLLSICSWSAEGAG